MPSESLGVREDASSGRSFDDTYGLDAARSVSGYLAQRHHFDSSHNCM